MVRPGGGVVALWRDSKDAAPPWAKEVLARLEPLWERTRHPGIVEGRRAEALERHGGFAPVRRVEAGFEDTIDRSGTLAWFASFSVVGALPDGEREALLDDFAAILLDRHDVRTVHRPWRVDIWVTRRR